MLRLLVIGALAALFIAGCGPVRTSTGPGALPPSGALRLPSSQYIKHVVVIVQENRSFDNFFAGFPGANAPTFGCAAGGVNARRAVRTGSSGCPAGDQRVNLHLISFKGPDLRHNWESSMTDWDNGRMDGFYAYGLRGPDEAYAYVDHKEIAPYWTIASQWVLADAMYPTEFGGSFTAHLTLVAGTDDIKNHPTSRAEVNWPNDRYDDCDSPPGTTSSYLTPDRVVHPDAGPFPCFKQFNTIAQVLDNAGVSWKYYAHLHKYAGMWSPFEAIAYVRRGPDWKKNIIAPETKVLSDVARGKLAAVSWITPSKADSDHPEARSDHGPSWVASVVNAIGESSYWQNTAIIILWDDWGGWYDNAPPPQVDYRGLGIRVPCLIVSPYAKMGSGSGGFVTHTQYEYGSILKFIEETFGLPYIGNSNDGYTDERANSLSDSFDFTQSPRPFSYIPSKYPASRFIHEPPSDAPVDTE
jgi:phospholipase C